MTSALLEVHSLTKSYPGVIALYSADLTILPGEVHALVGENGAGKSTLARMIAGIARPDSGRMLLRGSAYAPASRPQAQQLGVGIVMQELNLIPTLSVAENIFLDRMPRRLGLVDYRRMNAQARAILSLLGLADIDPARRVATLGVGQQQMAEIASVLSRPCDLLILDEPTAALTQRETDLLFQQIRRLQAAGTSIIYISHRMEEIKRLADRITILRDGKVITTCDAADLTIDEVIRLMVGRELRMQRGMGGSPMQSTKDMGEPPMPPKTIALRVENLARAPAVRGVSFQLHRGEILGFSGLMGSGRTETMRLIFGADRPDNGSIYLHGSATPAKIRSPRDAVRQGIALLTEDRKQQGLLLPLSIRANTTLVRMRGVSRLGGWISSTQEQAAAERYTRSLAVKCRSSAQTVMELSGGNQQKVIMARWLYRDCDILIFDEPTRGIDVGAKFEIYQLLSNLAQQGKAILVVSSDLPELLAISDRIAVMSAGRLAAIFPRDEFSQDTIMTAALSGYRADTVASGVAHVCGG
jgi:ribose transport system ATP-binding protein